VQATSTSAASSQHYVTLGLQFVDAFNRGDFDACVELLDPEVEWYTSNHFYESELHEGRADIRAYLESLTGHLEDQRLEPEDGLQIGDHVMLINRLHGRGTLAGHDVVERLNWVAHLEGERFRRVVAYPTPADARKALEAAASGASPSLPKRAALL
jgi:ketosteroid isomerase-like protein